MPMAAPTVSGVRPPDSAKGARETLERAPVEGDTVAAGKRRAGIGLGVEQNVVGACGKGGAAATSAAVGDRDGLHHRQSGAGLDRGDALGRLAAMKLEEVGAHGRRSRCRSAHRRDRPGRRPFRSCRAPRARASRPAAGVEVARALCEEHEPDIVGACFRRGFDDGRRPHAADFDLDRHVWLSGEVFGGF